MTRLVALACLLLSRPLLAAAPPLDFDTARGAREVGMGGTFRELGIGANAADGNPAAMGLFQSYQLEFGGGYDWKSKGWFAAGWVRDSTNPEFSGAYSLHYISNDYGAGNVGQWAHSLAIATRLGDKVSVGIGGRWLIQSMPKINAASMNVGVSILVLPQLTLGFAGYNLIDTQPPGAVPQLRGGLRAAARSGPPGDGGAERHRTRPPASHLELRAGALPRAQPSPCAAGGSGASRCSRTSSPRGWGW